MGQKRTRKAPKAMLLAGQAPGDNLSRGTTAPADAVEEQTRIARRILRHLLEKPISEQKLDWLPNLGVKLVGSGSLCGTRAVVLMFPARACELLSARQSEVVNLVAEGLPDKTIAARLGIHESTVRAHMRESERRLGVTSRPQLAMQVALLRLAHTCQ